MRLISLVCVKCGKIIHFVCLPDSLVSDSLCCRLWNTPMECFVSDFSKSSPSLSHKTPGGWDGTSPAVSGDVFVLSNCFLTLPLACRLTAPSDSFFYLDRVCRKYFLSRPLFYPVSLIQDLKKDPTNPLYEQSTLHITRTKNSSLKSERIRFPEVLSQFSNVEVYRIKNIFKEKYNVIV